MSTEIAPNHPCSYLTALPPALHPDSGWFAHDRDYFAAQMDVFEIPCGDRCLGILGTGSGAIVVIGLVGEHDALAEQVEVGAAVHLPFDHLDAVDVAFDRPELQETVSPAVTAAQSLRNTLAKPRSSPGWSRPADRLAVER